MTSIIKTIGGLDKSNRQFMFKKFDKYEQNTLHKDAPILQFKIQQLESNTLKAEYNLDTDELASDTSGNHSEDDEINKI